MGKHVLCRAGLGMLALLVLPACGTADPVRTEESPGGGEQVGFAVQSLDPSFVAAPGGARRVLARHYVRAVEDIFGANAAAVARSKVPRDPRTGGVDAIAARDVPIDPLSVLQLEQSGFAIADAALASPTRLAEHAPCVTQGSVSKAARDFCYGQVAQRIANLAWRVPPTPDRKNRLIALGQLGEQGATTDQERLQSGLRVILATILQTPSFLYSLEVGVPQAGSSNRTLNGFELATRMSLFLVGRLPSEALLQRAATGGLSTESGVRAAAAELLATPQAQEGFRDHVDEMFDLKRVPDQAKPGLTEVIKASMVEEVQRFVESFVFGTPRSFLGVLTEEARFVDSNVASIYGITVGSGWQLVDFSAPALQSQQRAGILSTPAMMTIQSHLTLNSPTRRGLFIRDRLLCDSISPPPPGLDITPKPPSPGQTLRQRMELDHAAGPCQSCHSLMDPLGFPYEKFGVIGEHRTQDNGQPLDLTGTWVSGSNVYAYDGPRELSALLADPAIGVGASGTAIARCWINQLYRSAVGIKEALDQESALVDLHDAFAVASYDMRQLLIEIVASPAFRQVGPLR